ncbi:MAG: chemotaxis protein CheW [Negativicutes bacterium]|nr:chemotaxis protein CheW [Negativicutes bacterium]
MQLLTFAVRGRWYVVDAARVQEVQRLESYTEVPAVHPAVVGLMNLRGQIVTLLDIGRLLTRAGDADGYRECVIFKRPDEDGDLLAITVDATGEVCQLAGDSWRELPEGMMKEEVQWLEAVVDIKGRICPVLAVERLFAGLP